MTVVLAARFPDYGGAMIADSQESNLGTGYKRLLSRKIVPIGDIGSGFFVAQSGDAAFGDFVFEYLQKHLDVSSLDAYQDLKRVLQEAAASYVKTPDGLAKSQRENAAKRSRFLTLRTTQQETALYAGTTQSQRRQPYTSCAVGSGSKIASSVFRREQARWLRENPRYPLVPTLGVVSCMLLAYSGATQRDLFCGGTPDLVLTDINRKPKPEQAIFALRLALARKQGLLVSDQELQAMEELLIQDADHLSLEEMVISQAKKGVKRELTNVLRGY